MSSIHRSDRFCSSEDRPHGGSVWAMDKRPDKRGFVTGSGDKHVKFWDFNHQVCAFWTQCTYAHVGMPTLIYVLRITLLLTEPLTHPYTQSPYQLTYSPRYVLTHTPILLTTNILALPRLFRQLRLCRSRQPDTGLQLRHTRTLQMKEEVGVDVLPVLHRLRASFLRGISAATTLAYAACTVQPECSHPSPDVLCERRCCVWRTARLTRRRSCCWPSPCSTARVRFGVACGRPRRHSDAVALAVKVFFEDTLKFFLSLYGHRLPVLSMSISHDDNLIVTASADKNVKIWGASGHSTRQCAHA